MKKPPPNAKGVTLVELLVWILIIAVVTACGSPLYVRVQRKINAHALGPTEQLVKHWTQGGERWRIVGRVVSGDLSKQLRLECWHGDEWRGSISHVNITTEEAFQKAVAALCKDVDEHYEIEHLKAQVRQREQRQLDASTDELREWHRQANEEADRE